MTTELLSVEGGSLGTGLGLKGVPQDGPELWSIGLVPMDVVTSFFILEPVVTMVASVVEA